MTPSLARSCLQRDFYARCPAIVARELLGATLWRRSRQGLVGGIVVETEAYLSQGDDASHSARGMTPRNRSMFGAPGLLYVYAIHAKYCLNVVTEERGLGSAVLIRALEPVRGIELMQARRGKQDLLDLTRGPARLCQALDVDRALDGWNLTLGRTIWLEARDEARFGAAEILDSPRIGISKSREHRLRFHLRSPFVSRMPRGFQRSIDPSEGIAARSPTSQTESPSMASRETAAKRGSPG